MKIALRGRGDDHVMGGWLGWRGSSGLLVAYHEARLCARRLWTEAPSSRGRTHLLVALQLPQLPSQSCCTVIVCEVGMW